MFSAPSACMSGKALGWPVSSHMPSCHQPPACFFVSSAARRRQRIGKPAELPSIRTCHVLYPYVHVYCAASPTYMSGVCRPSTYQVLAHNPTRSVSPAPIPASRRDPSQDHSSPHSFIMTPAKTCAAVRLHKPAYPYIPWDWSPGRLLYSQQHQRYGPSRLAHHAATGAHGNAYL
jgi:hypothetical protein